VLKCERLTAYYDAARILFDVSFELEAKKSACLLGRNGVGKTTCLRAIMGLMAKRSGAVSFEEKPIQNLPAFRIAQLGVGYVPEDRRIFPDLTVEENLQVGERNNEGGISWSLDRSYAMFPALHEFRLRQGGFLSGGQQQMLTIARTLMGQPKLLLIDEPTEGLSPLIVETLVEAILELKREGLTMLLAAQDMQFASQVADQIYLMNRGAIVYSGTPDSLKVDTDAVAANLAV
jgi:branched-chain amino acid transport system ATP-binding protein